MQTFIMILAIAILVFIGFCIYFIFKVLQFVIQAINLYKDMIFRQDTTIKLLKDIRDNRKGASRATSSEPDGDIIENENDPSIIYCTDCGAKLSENASSCKACGFQLVA